jgi:glycosyltransferase involved in cell wall biosynthesis
MKLAASGHALSTNQPEIPMQTSPPIGSLKAQPDAFARHSRTPLIVFSHLRWGFVFQRPQHLLTRLARHFDVYFIEEPVFADAEPALMSATHPDGVEVLTPRTGVVMPGFHDEQMPVLRRLVADFVAARGIADPLVWLYTPMALPLVADLDPLALVYDCMDDLASFKFAPPQLVEREAALMRLADLVLTGGPSLYEARQGRHPNLHCLPSAVDAAHFAASNLDGRSAEAEAARALHAGLGHPRLGFFGVIDERLDLELLAGLADRRPDWQIVMVGPVVKIDPAALPQRPNIRWLGMQRYEALPHLTAQWDVCLLPFALNDATRFISPTKTLEYLAAGKPVVSTPIRAWARRPTTSWRRPRRRWPTPTSTRPAGACARRRWWTAAPGTGRPPSSPGCCSASFRRRPPSCCAAPSPTARRASSRRTRRRRSGRRPCRRRAPSSPSGRWPREKPA